MIHDVWVSTRQEHNKNQGRKVRKGMPLRETAVPPGAWPRKKARRGGGVHSGRVRRCPLRRRGSRPCEFSRFRRAQPRWCVRERGVLRDSLRPQACSTREQDLKRSVFVTFRTPCLRLLAESEIYVPHVCDSTKSIVLCENLSRF